MLERRPEPGQEKLTVQEDELEAAAWMPLEEYSQIPFQRSKTILRQILDCCLAYAGGNYSGMRGIKLGDVSGGRSDLLVHAHLTCRSPI